MADGLELIYDDESGTWSEAPETYGSIAFDTQEALEKAVNILNNYKWTSVDEALPEKDGYYLVVTQGIHNPTIDIAGFWHYAEWVQKEIRENYWNKYDKVLYWQPLPELPEAIKG